MTKLFHKKGKLQCMRKYTFYLNIQKFKAPMKKHTLRKKQLLLVYLVDSVICVPLWNINGSSGGFVKNNTKFVLHNNVIE